MEDISRALHFYRESILVLSHGIVFFYCKLSIYLEVFGPLSYMIKPSVGVPPGTRPNQVEPEKYNLKLVIFAVKKAKDRYII
jgi:hypothetical protein